MNEKNSIAIVINGLYLGGAERFGVILANKFADNGYKTSIFIFKKVDSPLVKLIDKRIELVEVPRKSKYDLVLHKPFNDELKKRNITKVFIIGLFPVFLSRILSFTRDKSLNYFISLHSTIPGSFKTYLQNLYYLRFIRKTDKVLFICNNQKLYYNSKYYFNPQQVDVIYNGVNIEQYKPGAGEPAFQQREKMKIGADDKIILLTAAIRPEKGHAYAIESLSKLHSRHTGKTNTHLVFIGGGNEEYVASLKKLVKDYSLESFVHFEGSHSDVRKYYEIADVFTLTSYSVETFSLAALEAMCYGLPLSLTNIGGASEMIFEGKNGLLSNAKDVDSIASTWANLLDANLDRKAIRAIAVNNFSLDLMFSRYEETINQ